MSRETITPHLHTHPQHLTGEAPDVSVVAVGMWLESRDMKMFVFGKVQAEGRRATQEERSLGAPGPSSCCLLATPPDG